MPFRHPGVLNLRSTAFPLDSPLWQVEYEDHQERLAVISGLHRKKKKREPHVSPARQLEAAASPILLLEDRVEPQSSIFATLPTADQEALLRLVQLLQTMDSAADNRILLDELLQAAVDARLLRDYTGVYPSLAYLGRAAGEEDDWECNESFGLDISTSPMAHDAERMASDSPSTEEQQPSLPMAREFVVSPPPKGRVASSGNLLALAVPTPPRKAESPRSHFFTPTNNKPFRRHSVLGSQTADRARTLVLGTPPARVPPQRNAMMLALDDDAEGDGFDDGAVPCVEVPAFVLEPLTLQDGTSVEKRRERREQSEAMLEELLRPDPVQQRVSVVFSPERHRGERVQTPERPFQESPARKPSSANDPQRASSEGRRRPTWVDLGVADDVLHSTVTDMQPFGSFDANLRENSTVDQPTAAASSGIRRRSTLLPQFSVQTSRRSSSVAAVPSQLDLLAPSQGSIRRPTLIPQFCRTSRSATPPTPNLSPNAASSKDNDSESSFSLDEDDDESSSSLRPTSLAGTQRGSAAVKSLAEFRGGANTLSCVFGEGSLNASGNNLPLPSPHGKPSEVKESTSGDFSVASDDDDPVRKPSTASTVDVKPQSDTPFQTPPVTPEGDDDHSDAAPSPDVDEALDDDPAMAEAPADARSVAFLNVGALPMTVDASRLIVYFSDCTLVTSSDDKTRHPFDGESLPSLVELAQSRGSEGCYDFFQQYPEGAKLVVPQDPSSTCCEPCFTIRQDEMISLRNVKPSSLIVCLVECIVNGPSAANAIVYGHAVLRIGKESLAKGSFYSRLRPGDPRTAPTATGTDGRPVLDLMELLQDSLPRPRYLPLCFVCWRVNKVLDCRHSAFRKDPHDPKRSSGEFDLAADIVHGNDDAHRRTPADFGFDSAAAITRLIDEAESVPVHLVPDLASPIAQYSPKRPFFINIESLLGMEHTEGVIYKVHAEVASASETSCMQFTRSNDFNALFGGSPKFLDSPMLFEGVPPSNVLAVVVFRVFSMDMNAAGSRAVELVAWSIAKLFIEEGVLRHGRLSVPLFSGAPPEDFLEDTMSVKLEEVVIRWSTAGQIKFMKPLSTLNFAIGDVARMPEVLTRCGLFLESRMILVPKKRKKSFGARVAITEHESFTPNEVTLERSANSGLSRKRLHDALGIAEGAVADFASFMNARFEQAVAPPPKSAAEAEARTSAASSSTSSVRSGTQLLKDGKNESYRPSASQLVRSSTAGRRSSARATQRASSMRRFSSALDLNKAWERHRAAQIAAQLAAEQQRESEGERGAFGQVVPFFEAFSEESVAGSGVDRPFNPEEDEFLLAVDNVGRLPLGVAVSRILVYVADAIVGESPDDGESTLALSASEFFTSAPQICTFQDFDSSCTEPSFCKENDFSFWLKPTSMAVVIVECVQRKGGSWFTYGHAVLPVGASPFYVGNFFSRLRPGDPRTPEAHTTSDGLPIFSRDSLFTNSTNAADYIPLGFVRWRANCEKLPAEPDPRDPPQSDGELILSSDAETLPPASTPNDFGIKTDDDAEYLFSSGEMLYAHQATDTVCNLMTYNEERAMFVNVESVVGLEARRDVLYKVHVEVASATGACMQYTQRHDLTALLTAGESSGSDGALAALAAAYEDFPMVFNAVRHDPFAIIIFRIFSVNVTMQAEKGIHMVGWAVSKIFAEPTVLRQGRFQIPVFSGGPPEDFLDDTMSVKLEEMVLKWTNAGEIKFMKPLALLNFAMGDQARMPEILIRKGFFVERRMILVPKKRKKSFTNAAAAPLGGESGPGALALTGTFTTSGVDMTQLLADVNERFEAYLA